MGWGLGHWAKGICRLQALNRNPVGGLGGLQECVEAGRSFWWGAGGQAEVAQNLADHGGVFNACPEPAEGAARMVNGPPHWGQVVMSMAKTRLSNWAQLIRARGEAEGDSSSRLAMSVSGLASPGTI